jgi:hypothetical protein
VKLLFDTVNLEDITEIDRWGVLDGVTSNPTLAAKEGRDFASMIEDVCAEVEGDVSADIATLPTQVFRQMVKLPLTDLGLERFLADRAASLEATRSS